MSPEARANELKAGVQGRRFDARHAVLELVREAGWKPLKIQFPEQPAALELAVPNGIERDVLVAARVAEGDQAQHPPFLLNAVEQR